MSKVTIAVTQFACVADAKANCDTAERLARKAAGQGANIILLQELFQTPYFCSEEHASFFALAETFEGNKIIARFAGLAKELGVVMPISFFERAGTAHYNSMAMIDADGSILGLYRKSHIPDGPGYEEKYYFSPGDTGFKVWPTAFGQIGVGICWDQWFPETARIMALKGAELLLYPTAIGSEPPAPGYDSMPHWQNTMRGHAAANIMPLAAANRIGKEIGPKGTEIEFYGSSFIADAAGEKQAEASRNSEAILTYSFDFDALRQLRRSWGLFRDRRPDIYGPLLTLDGKTQPYMG
jgi:N-carbamoylputrescine amidase